MALSPKERERIIEEEQLRFETRRNLHRGNCSRCRPGRFLWWVLLAVLLVIGVQRYFCGGLSCPMAGAWQGRHCTAPGYAVPGADQGVQPGQPLPPKK